MVKAIVSVVTVLSSLIFAALVLKFLYLLIRTAINGKKRKRAEAGQNPVQRFVSFILIMVIMSWFASIFLRNETDLALANYHLFYSLNTIWMLIVSGAGYVLAFRDWSAKKEVKKCIKKALIATVFLALGAYFVPNVVNYALDGFGANRVEIIGKANIRSYPEVDPAYPLQCEGSIAVQNADGKVTLYDVMCRAFEDSDLRYLKRYDKEFKGPYAMTVLPRSRWIVDARHE